MTSDLTTGVPHATLVDGTTIPQLGFALVRGERIGPDPEVVGA